MITLSKPDFNKLLGLLSLMKDVCNDADIRNGELRQISNNRTFLIEANLEKYLGKNDLVLPVLKNKLQLLKIFLDGDDSNDIIFQEENGKYVFTDNISQLRFTIADSSQYLDNQYYKEEDKSTLFKISENQKYMEFTLNKYALNKIKVITENLNVDDIIIDIENGIAKVNIVSFNKLNDATIIKNIPTKNIEGKQRIILSSTPFKLDFTNDLEVHIYKNLKDEDNKILVAINTKYYDIDLFIYIPGFINPVEKEDD